MSDIKPKYAIFDFDGTLVSKDTLLSILKICFKAQPWRLLFFIPFSPIILITYLFRLDRSLAKSLVLWSATFFKSKKQIIKIFNQDIIQECQPLWFQEGIQTLNKLYQEGQQIIIATASGQIWIRALLRKKFPHSKLIIGTRLKFCLGGVILASKNCRNSEKLRRIREQLGFDFEWVSSWSDHTADIPMLKEAQTPYIICPKKEHVVKFKKEFGEQVKILNWKTQ